MQAVERPLVLDLLRRTGGNAEGGYRADGDLDADVVFVCPDGPRLGGFVALAIKAASEGAAGTRAHVVGWFVKPNLLDTLAPAALLEAAEAWARTEGVGEIVATMPLTAAADVGAYRAAGFAPSGLFQQLRKSLTSPAVPAAEIRVEAYTGPRADLRGLFQLAEDSTDQLDSYIDLGRVLVAVSDGEVIGHLQLTDTADPDQVEIKNMAVREDHQGQGVGRRLIQAAADLLASEAVAKLIVATAAADTANLRFYQRQGFRMRSVERDAFTAATGYPHGVRIDGIELRDRVWMDRPLPARTMDRRALPASRALALVVAPASGRRTLPATESPPEDATRPPPRP
jgi:GNAT superfamily N-acetyltransferase